MRSIVHRELGAPADTMNTGRLATVSSTSAAARVDVSVRYGDGRWPGLEATFPILTAFLPGYSHVLLEPKSRSLVIG
jgi:hypothetical protein